MSSTRAAPELRQCCAGAASIPAPSQPPSAIPATSQQHASAIPATSQQHPNTLGNAADYGKFPEPPSCLRILPVPPQPPKHAARVARATQSSPEMLPKRPNRRQPPPESWHFGRQAHDCGPADFGTRQGRGAQPRRFCGQTLRARFAARLRQNLEGRGARVFREESQQSDCNIF